MLPMCYHFFTNCKTLACHCDML